MEIVQQQVKHVKQLQIERYVYHLKEQHHQYQHQHNHQIHVHKQLQEDVEATKVRLERQAEFQRTMQRGESVAKMFDPLDNLKRSMDAIEDGDAKEGLKMVVSQFMGALEELGLEVLSPVGMPFDPNLHEALSVVPVAEAEQDGMVIEVFSAGYRVGSRLLKPARVIIGRHEGAEA